MIDVKTMIKEHYEKNEIFHVSLKAMVKQILMLNMLVFFAFSVSISIIFAISFLADSKIYIFSVLLIDLVLVLITAVLVYSNYKKIAIKIKESMSEHSTDIKEILTAKGRFELILESVTDSVAIMDNDFKFIYGNSEVSKRIKRLGAENFIGKRFTDLFSGPKHIDFYEACERVMKYRVKEIEKTHFTYSDGSTGWYETTIYPITDGLMLIDIDVTDKRETEIALQVSETKYRELFNYASDAILLAEMDGKNIQFTDANEKACEVFGYSKEEFLSLSLVDILAYENDIENIINGILENGTITSEIMHRCKSGSIIPMELSDKVTMINGKYMIIFTSRDISDRMKGLKIVYESEEKYRHIFEFSPDAIFVQYNDRIVLANPAALSFFGVAKLEELILKSVKSGAVVYMDYIDEFNKMYSNALKGKSNYNRTEIKMINGYGDIIDTEINLLPLSYNGEPAVQVIVRDISERKKLEEARNNAEISKLMLQEALEYDKMKTEFFSNISHELRTPLNIILGTLQLHDVYEKNNNISAFDTNKYFRIMKQNCCRLLRLINNLIDITKIDAGFYTLELKNCNIVSLVEDITLSVADYVEKRGVYIEFETDTEEKVMACDPDKIERIILNLLSNAIKHTKANDNIFVNIEDNNEQVKIVIRDTGEGIPQDKLKIIFERFRQVDKTLTRKNEGSGIGLSLVKSLVEMHGGLIDVRSIVGQGSEFIIMLPAKICDEYPVLKEENYINNSVERISIEFSDIYKIN